MTESSVGRMLTRPALTLAAVLAAITKPAVPADAYQAVELEAPGIAVLRLNVGSNRCNPSNNFMPWDPRVREARPCALLDKLFRVTDAGGVNSDKNFVGFMIADGTSYDLPGSSRCRALNYIEYI